MAVLHNMSYNGSRMLRCKPADRPLQGQTLAEYM
jgi:hypothetical protein